MTHREIVQEAAARLGINVSAIFALTYREAYEAARNLAALSNQSLRAALNLRRTPTKYEIRKYLIDDAEKTYRSYIREMTENVHNVIAETRRAINNIQLTPRNPFIISKIDLTNVVDAIMDDGFLHDVYMREVSKIFPRGVIYAEATDETYRVSRYVYNNNYIQPTNTDAPLHFLSILGGYDKIEKWRWFVAPEPNPEAWRTILVAAAPVMNCGINTIAKQLPEAKRKIFLAEYGHIPSTQKISLDMLDKIGRSRKYGISIQFITPISVALKKPALTAGRNGGTAVKALLTTGHTTVVPVAKSFVVQYVDERPDLPLERLSDDAWIERGEPDDNGTQINTIYKRIRPSTITGIPADDECPKFAALVDASAILLKHWARTSNFIRTQQNVAETVKAACIPFGEARFIDYLQTPDKCTEVDMNMSYSSFETCKYFAGFPNGFYRRSPVLSSMENIAFVSVLSMEPNTPEGHKLWPILTKLRGDLRCITGPMFHFLKQYFTINVAEVLYAYRWTEGKFLHLLPEENKKIIANKCIGRLVAGGLSAKPTTKITTYGEGEYIEFCRQECAANDIPHTISAVGDDLCISADVPTVSGAKYLDVYAYVLGYSQISTLSMVLQITTPIYSMKVDAIHIHPNAPINFPAYPREQRYVAGEWKYAVRRTPPILCTDAVIEFAKPSTEPDPQLPLLPRLVIEAPPGTCKTYNATSTAPRGSLLLSPTKILTHKAQQNGRLSAHCIQLLAYHLRKVDEYKANNSPQLPRARIKVREIVGQASEIYADEFAATDFNDIKCVEEFCQRRGLFFILIGDTCQKINKINSAPATRESLEARGVVFYTDPINARSPADDKNHRHTYEYCTFLDTLRGLPFHECLSAIINSNRYKIVDKCPEGSKLIAGVWRVIAKHHETLTGPIRVRKLADKSPAILDIDSGDVWTQKKSMRDVLPIAEHGNGVNVPRFIGDEACTVEGCQGETITYPICLDVNTLTDAGALYTALTRTPTADLITILLN